jgi:hypothetical protein
MTLPRKLEPEEELIPANDPHSLPRESGIFPVTPEMASSWLSYRNHPKNRPLSSSVSSRYQADMEGGRWREGTPEGLIFDTDGYIVSGQHRLRAQANSGLTLQWWIFVDEPREIFDHIDQGFRRTAAHLIRDKYASQAAAGARHLAALADGDQWGMPRYGRVTTPEIIETYHAWPELTWYLTDVMGAHFDAGITAPPHLAVMAMAARTEHRDKIPGWLEALRSGAIGDANDPRLRLRNRFMGGYASTGQGVKRDVVYALIVKAWNAHVRGEKLQVLAHRVSEPLPTVEAFSFKNDERKGNAA